MEFGATDFINASDTDAVKEVIEMTKGGVHHAFEAIGLAKTAEQAFNMLRRGGTANIIGMIPVGQMVSIMGAALPLGEKKLQWLADGLQPLPGRHAAVRGLLHVGQAEARPDDLPADQAGSRSTKASRT